MFASVHKLRTMGALDSAKAPPRDQWMRGILEFSRAATIPMARTPFRLILRHAQANPDNGVLLELYKPELVSVPNECMRFRGLEPVRLGESTVGVMLQEWLVIVPAVSQDIQRAAGQVVAPHSR